MNRKVKAAVFGCGHVSRYIMRYLGNAGAEVVAAFDISPDMIGKDIGTLTDSGETGITISAFSDADAVLSQVNPDICVIATVSTLSGIVDTIKLCAEHGCNIVTTCEEAAYPWNSLPETAEQIDRLAKDKGVTISSSGVPDMHWGALIDIVAGTMNTLTRIEGVASANLEGYYKEVAAFYGAGLSQDEFEKQFCQYNSCSAEEQRKLIMSGAYTPCHMWQANGWICEKMGLTVKSQIERKYPATDDVDFYSKTMERTMKAGEPIGTDTVVTTETEEGLTIETRFIVKLHRTGSALNNWNFIGEPETSIKIDCPDGAALAASGIVNRIPGILNAEPGFVATNKLTNCRFLVKPMNEYVTSKTTVVSNEL